MTGMPGLEIEVPDRHLKLEMIPSRQEKPVGRYLAPDPSWVSYR